MVQSVKRIRSSRSRQSDATMPFMAHIVELRKRLIYVLIAFAGAMVLGFLAADTVISFLQEAAPEAIGFVVIGLTDAFRVYVLFAIAVGIVVSFPVAMYQVWAFLSPGLTKKERKLTVSFIPFSAILFVAGIGFGYYWLFPFVVQFMTGIAERVGAQEMYGMIQYFKFMFTLVVPFGFLFQMPVLVMFLTRLGIISPSFLRRVRKYAYFLLLVIAAFITPPELLSHLMVTVPLILLYEISIIFARLVVRRRKREIEKADDLDQGHA